MQALLDIIARHKGGAGGGVFSVCSAHPLVLRALFRERLADGGVALVEATSNQVNQFGGYTGLLPSEFRRRVLELAQAEGLPPSRVLLGGDHLGPNCWRSSPAAEAMKQSETLVRHYIEAGFRKIHLDCSMGCGGDPQRLDDATVAARAARLCAAAEDEWRRSGGEAPVYVIGTEVPTPGGAREQLQGVHVTTASAVALTLDAHKHAWLEAGLGDAWVRVIAVVVQPGVEFDHDHIVDYEPHKAQELRRFIAREPRVVFEAHSTDYQRADRLAQLVRDHFAILKVGPALTFALREALWALDRIAEEWPAGARVGPRLSTLVDEVMQREPAHWRSYYTDAARESFDRSYSFSDRVRYYWPVPAVESAVGELLRRFDAQPPPLTLISQYLPLEYAAIRAGVLALRADDLILFHIGSVLRQYAAACAFADAAEEETT